MKQSPSYSSSRFIPEQFIKEVQELYSRSFSYILFAGFLVALVATMVLWHDLTHNIILYWFTAYCLLCFVRYSIYVNFKSHAEGSIQSASLWFILLLVGSLFNGLFWGCLGVVLNAFVSLEPGQLLFLNSFLVIIIAALTASSTVIYSSNPTLMLSFSLPAVGPYTLYLLNHQLSYLSMIGCILLVFYLSLLAVYSRLDIAFFRLAYKKVSKPLAQSSTKKAKIKIKH